MRPAFVRKKILLSDCLSEFGVFRVSQLMSLIFPSFNEVFLDFFRWCSGNFFVCVLPVLFYVHGVMHLPSPSFLLPLCQELGANIPHALLAQPEKYGTVTATVLPDWTGTLMRRLTALIQAASTANSEDFYSFTGPPLCVSIHVFVFVIIHLFMQVRSACSLYSLCRWKPAGRAPSKSDSTAWLLLSLVAREL